LDLTDVKLLFENEMAMLENTNPEIAKRRVARSRFNKIIRMVIFENGKQIVEIPYDYGKQRIVVYYGKEEIGSIGQWRTNDYHVHNYIVSLRNEGEGIVLSGGIKGPDDSFLPNF